MSAVDVGRICVKLTGREAGKKCVIVDVVDRNFVLVTGPKQVNGMKRRRVNVNHIEPTERKINIKRGDTDDQIMKALDEQTTAYIKEAVKPRI